MKTPVLLNASSPVLPAFADDLNHALLHGDGVKAPVSRTAHNFVQQKMHQVLVRNEAPEVELQVVAVHLDLLQAEASERPQADALQESLQADLDDARQHGDLGGGKRKEGSKRGRK